MEACGFELESELETVHGSFFQRLKFWTRDERTKEEVAKVFQQGKEALLIRHLDLPAAKATGTLADAASKLIKSLETVESCAMRVGGILVLKTIRQGKPSLIIETITPAMARELDEHPTLLQNPEAIFKLLETQGQLQETDVHGTNLTDATDLTQPQIDAAHVDERSKLLEDL